ncbi:BON domain-containing protein [Paractinoplanes hotanensis]|uniref:BON domain-containing protein n=1 Tax=Paractinoplanes hotanensis TaxID=2906497 RepID=A0ABT0YCP7_9ACTN|nr:BON domain-containing protein [Actinoplanes hotanensis]MCM4083833.1 BON domain-containing protein [Actinoplanes hotanensis]
MHPFTGPDDGQDADFDVTAWVAGLNADDRLADLAAENLSSDPLVRGSRLEIIVQNGVVILQGELESEEAREAARRRAWTLPGIRDVCDAVKTPMGGV